MGRSPNCHTPSSCLDAMITTRPIPDWLYEAASGRATRIVDYRATLTADRAQLAIFNEECLRRGVVKGAQKIYVSLAHTDTDIDRTLEVFPMLPARLGDCCAQSLRRGDHPL